METKMQTGKNQDLGKEIESRNFMAAVMVAGENGCKCRACQALQKLKEKMIGEAFGGEKPTPTT